MTDNNVATEGKSDRFWKMIYLGVVLFTILIVSLLWAFSQHFS